MIRVENLKKTFAARTLFEGVSYHFPTGERCALVGANGAGKTTLLNILCRLEEADDGKVLVPSGTQVGYLPQKPNPDPKPTVIEECLVGAAHIAVLKDEMDEALHAMHAEPTPAELAKFERAESEYRRQGGYSIESAAHGILRGLGYSTELLGKSPRELSGGWRMRLELAKLFLGRPDFLILDEPTNHLDLPSLVWVENYLMNFRGTLLFVSHDKALLNRLSTITLHLHGQTLQPYRGNFDQFLDQRDARMEQEAAGLDALKKRREAMESFVTRFGAKASKATQAQSRVKMITRIKELEQNFNVTEGDGNSITMTLPPPAKTPRIVYEIHNGSIGYDRPLSRGVELTIERGLKVAIIGANGIGKSTLLKTVAGRLPALGGEFKVPDGLAIAYFAQDQTETLDQDRSVLKNLQAASDMSERDCRSLLGHFLFRGDDVFKATRVLSGGELSRLGLACALGKRSSFLLLDEPTNHLDMASVEALAGCLADYEGTVLFVSHDRHFIDEVATHIFAMLPDGRSALFEGKLGDYERLARTAGFPNVLEHDEMKMKAQDTAAKPAAAAAAAGVSDAQIKDLKRSRQKLENRVEQLEKNTGKLKAGIAALEHELAALPASAYGKARELHAQQTDLAKKLEVEEEKWLAVYAELEAVNEKLAATGRSV